MLDRGGPEGYFPQHHEATGKELAQWLLYRVCPRAR